MQVVAAPVEAVTVFRNGALVERRGTGRGPLAVEGLPLLFSSDTLRVRPERGAVQNIEELVRVTTTAAAPPVDEEARAKVALQIARIDDEGALLQALQQALGALVPVPPDPKSPATGKVDGKLYRDLVKFAAEESEAVSERYGELVRERRALMQELARIEQRDEGDRAPPRVLRGAKFSIDVDEPTAFTLEYFVPAARWVPAYALHLEGGKARLVVAALVAQATGEDWSNVRLSVSTADLMRESTLPVLSSWRIGRAQPPVARGWRPLPSDLPSLFWGYDHQPKKPPPAPPAPPPPQPAPMMIAGRGAGAEFDKKMSTGELESFEDERTGKVLALGAELDDDVASGEGAAPQDMLAPQKATLFMRDMPAPAPAMAPALAPPPLAAARGGFGGAMAPKSAPRRDDVVRAQSELPPRWRTAYLRMAGPDEPRRGQLLPLDPIERLSWLLEASDVEGGGRSELQRAIQALVQAQQRLESAALPRGTSALSGTHFQAVMTSSAPADVPGDGAFWRVIVRADEGPAVIEHRCVPRESNDVWRTCKVDVKGPPLPVGPLAVYEDGAFKVNARLDGSGGGKALDVNLGVDPDVRVLSRTAQIHQAEKGLVSQTSRVEHKVRVELRNTRGQPATVVVHDRVPVPADNVKDVTVQILDERPPSKRTNKDAFGHEVQGAVEWRVTVMPGDTQVIEHRYAIDLPAKAELEGGNRRE